MWAFDLRHNSDQEQKLPTPSWMPPQISSYIKYSMSFALVLRARSTNPVAILGTACANHAPLIRRSERTVLQIGPAHFTVGCKSQPQHTKYVAAEFVTI